MSDLLVKSYGIRQNIVCMGCDTLNRRTGRRRIFQLPKAVWKHRIIRVERYFEHKWYCLIDRVGCLHSVYWLLEPAAIHTTAASDTPPIGHDVESVLHNSEQKRGEAETLVLECDECGRVCGGVRTRAGLLHL